MITSLVGYTGFVGSNIVDTGNFTHLYNSKNIETAFGTEPDLLVYAGVRAEKFLANQYPDQDLEIVKNALSIMKKIKPKKIVLISTIDVYKNPIHVNENSIIDTENLHPYGLNRYYLEQWVKESFDQSLIVRLPGLYGNNIKKNFIYDMIHIIPSMLRDNKYEELWKIDNDIEKYYINMNNGFYKCGDLSINERESAKNYFINIGFSALNFTDSRGSFQFYNLQYLWEHITIALNHKLHKLNIATEPTTINEIYRYIKGNDFVNEISNTIPDYNYKTLYYDIFNGHNGYIFDKEIILNDIKRFVEEYEV